MSATTPLPVDGGSAVGEGDGDGGRAAAAAAARGHGERRGRRESQEAATAAGSAHGSSYSPAGSGWPSMAAFQSRPCSVGVKLQSAMSVGPQSTSKHHAAQEIPFFPM